MGVNVSGSWWVRTKRRRQSVHCQWATPRASITRSRGTAWELPHMQRKRATLIVGGFYHPSSRITTGGPARGSADLERLVLGHPRLHPAARVRDVLVALGAQQLQRRHRSFAAEADPH